MKKLLRSNLAHKSLKKRALQKSRQTSGSISDDWDRKYYYHQDIIETQQQLGRVLTRSERGLIWKFTRSGGF